ncbi:hypothetical protein BJX68DRAFT_267651 [Aspergillus pseudodeflectus]|uniref:Uncharacterized protein n=1 Tax=Aspergillus pseudodeflectus TaxID=176178 RepID=A0ABR4K8W1_9EURO
MQYHRPDPDIKKPLRASMEEYSAFIRAETSHTPRRPQLHITPCAGGVVGLSLLLLLTACIYLLLLLRNLPLEMQSLVTDYAYKGPLPIEYDATHRAYITCPEVASDDNPSDCVLDLLAHGWVPNPCFDAQMHNDMLATHNYAFFRSRFGHEELGQDVVLQGNMSMDKPELWVRYADHVDSCLYLLNGSLRATAMRSVGRLDSWLDDGGMQHCFDVIRSSQDPKKMHTRVKVVFESRKCYLRGS